MPPQWHGINDLYFVKGKSEEKKGKPVDTEVETASEEEQSPEVKLIEGKWLPGNEGFQFNKKCNAQVKAKFLKETNRKKVTIDTFVEFEGEEEDLGQQVEAFLEDDGIGEAEVTLFYGEKYSNTIRENPGAICHYKFKAHHNACKKDIESELLEMPTSKKSTIRIRLNVDPEDESTQDDTFRLFSTDEPCSYDKTHTIKDDKIPGDDYLDLEYTDLKEGLSYTLEVNPGNEGKIYYCFEDKTYEELTNVS